MTLSAQRIDILGIPVDCVDMTMAIQQVDTLIQGEHAKTIIAVNPEKVIKAQQDAFLKKTIEEAGLLIPDGIGVVIAAKLSGYRHIQRTPGSELMPEICYLSEKKQYPVFLYGASPDVNKKCVAQLKKQYPNLNIAGHDHGYIEQKDMPQLIESINQSGAKVLFIALGSPRQELWMAQYLSQCTHVRVCQGVGGTFDVIAGNVKRAPKFFRNLHLEWFYRLASQPKRAFRQTALFKFFIDVLASRIFKRGKAVS